MLDGMEHVVACRLMIHPIHETYAHLLVHYCCEVAEGDNVMLNVESPALPMARALAREVLRTGGTPLLRITYPEWALDQVELAGEPFFENAPDVELAEIERTQAWIRVSAPTNKRQLQEVDKSRITRLGKRNRPVLDHRLEHTRWVGTLYPTDAGAQDAGMSLDAFERFVYGAMYLFDEDPVARWMELHAFQERLIERLSRGTEIRIVGEDTDLTLSVGGRTWINSHGKANMPSGEVFTGPVEDSATGVVRFHVPSSVNGSLVEDVRLRFVDGKVVDASSSRGEDLLHAQLETDGGARFLGEIGIGTNYEIRVPTLSTLFDEKIGGTVHLALGRSYVETGGLNESALHWDLICDLRHGGEMFLDGEAIQRDGQFLF